MQTMAWTRYKTLSSIFIGLSLAYLLLAALLPVDKVTLQKYHLSPTAGTALTLTIAIPYLIIWLIAMVGYARFQWYTDTIADSKDGKAFKIIAKGVLLMALWLPLSTVISTLASYYFRVHPGATVVMTNLINYSNLIILFIAFWWTNQGSQRLLSIVRKFDPRSSQWLIMAFLGFAALYTYLVLQDPARRHPTAMVTTATYYLPDWVIITTVVIPRLIMWFLGLQAVYNLRLYRKKVRGKIYKEGLRQVTWGIGCIIGISVILRCLQSLSPELNSWSLGLLLLIVYLLLLSVSLGYLLLARGARKLQLIEEI